MKTIKSVMRKNSAIRHKTYFFSDAHLGIGSAEEDHQRELRIIRFLDFIQQDADQIFIVGDLFDYWFEYKTVVPKKYFRLLAKIAEIIECGVRVYFIAGNHDFWIKDYFRTEIGMDLHLNPVETEINGKRFFIHHGDGLLKGDVGYRILKKVLRNRLNIFLYSLIHPDVAGWIARWSSHASRRYTSNRTYESSDMTEFAAQKIQDGFDFVIMGHNHISSLQKIGNGTYVNLGDWIFENTYAVFDGKKIKLTKYSG